MDYEATVTSNTSAIEERDPDWYIDDGNVVLKCRSPGKITYFRVHKSTLSRHSPVFRYMFEMPLSADTEQYDGVAAVDLFDNVKHLRDFIRIMHTFRLAVLPVFNAIFKTHFSAGLMLETLISWNAYMARCALVRNTKLTTCETTS